MKELRLAMHPAVYVFLLLSAMLLIPNYPYYVIFFYTALGIYFICLTGRENHDIEYSLALPIRKLDIVRARFMLVIVLQLAQTVLAVPFAVLRQGMALPGNQVGMDANIALFGLALGMLGAYNWLFLTRYYRNPNRVGAAFIAGSIGIGVYMIIAEVCAHAIPFFRERLDTPDPSFLGEKLLVLALGAAVYALLTWLAYRRAARAFVALDI